jgi:hypothetical protein
VLVRDFNSLNVNSKFIIILYKEIRLLSRIFFALFLISTVLLKFLIVFSDQVFGRPFRGTYVGKLLESFYFAETRVFFII